MQSVQPRIMWIDSSVQNLISYKDFFNDTDFELFTYLSPIEALTYLEKINPHVIIIDTDLTEIDPFELTNRIRQSELFQMIPIIFTINLSDEKMLMAAYEYQNVDIMSKPCKKLQTLFRVNSNFEKSVYQNELKDKLIEIEEKHAEVETLARILTHDISNSITIINQIAKKIENEKLQLAVKKVIEIVTHVKEVLSHSSGKILLEINDVNLQSSIKEVVQSYSNKLIEKNITVTGNWRDIEDVYIKADERTLKNQILANLFSNAIKFSYPQSQISIDIKTQLNEVQLSFKDQGQGIPVELIPKLFKRNEKTTRPGTANEPGTGFGLPIVKQYLDLMDAHINVSSIENKNNIASQNTGTTFTLTFKK